MLDVVQVLCCYMFSAFSDMFHGVISDHQHEHTQCGTTPSHSDHYGSLAVYYYLGSLFLRGDAEYILVAIGSPQATSS